MTLCLALIPAALSFLALSSHSVQSTAGRIQHALDDPTNERAVLLIQDEKFGHVGSVTYAIALKKQGDLSQAEAHIGLIDLDSLSPELQTVTYNLKGILLAARGDLEGARQAFESAVNIDPESAEVHFNLYRVNSLLDETGAADAALQAANARDGSAVTEWLKTEKHQLNGYFIDVLPSRNSVFETSFATEGIGASLELNKPATR